MIFGYTTTEQKPHILATGDFLTKECECCEKLQYAMVLERVGNVIFITDLANEIDEIDLTTVNTVTVQHLRSNDFKLLD